MRKWTGPGGPVQEPVLSRKKDKTMAATSKDATKEGTDLKASGGERRRIACRRSRLLSARPVAIRSPLLKRDNPTQPKYRILTRRDRARRITAVKARSSEFLQAREGGIVLCAKYFLSCASGGPTQWRMQIRAGGFSQCEKFTQRHHKPSRPYRVSFSWTPMSCGWPVTAAFKLRKRTTGVLGASQYSACATSTTMSCKSGSSIPWENHAL